MKTLDELKEAIDTPEVFCCHCDYYGEPNGCNYKPGACDAWKIAHDALAYINELEERISMMLIQMHGDCGCCIHRDRSLYESPCKECVRSDNWQSWEYDGLPEIPKEVQSSETD